MPATRNGMSQRSRQWTRCARVHAQLGVGRTTHACIAMTSTRPVCRRWTIAVHPVQPMSTALPLPATRCIGPPQMHRYASDGVGQLGGRVPSNDGAVVTQEDEVPRAIGAPIECCDAQGSDDSTASLLDLRYVLVRTPVTFLVATRHRCPVVLFCPQ